MHLISYFCLCWRFCSAFTHLSSNSIWLPSCCVFRRWRSERYTNRGCSPAVIQFTVSISRRFTRGVCRPESGVLQNFNKRLILSLCYVITHQNLRCSRIWIVTAEPSTFLKSIQWMKIVKYDLECHLKICIILYYVSWCGLYFSMKGFLQVMCIRFSRCFSKLQVQGVH